MKALWAMIKKEFLHISRDPQLVGLVLGLPVLLLILFGYALRLKVDHMAIAVLDQDKSFFSVTVKDRLQKDGQFNIVEIDSEQTIRDWLHSSGVPITSIEPVRHAQFANLQLPVNRRTRWLHRVAPKNGLITLAVRPGRR